MFYAVIFIYSCFAARPGSCLVLQPARPEMRFSTKFKMDLESGFSTEKPVGVG